MNSVFRKLEQEINKRAHDSSLVATDAANRAVEIPKGFHRLEAGTVLALGDRYWRHTFNQFIPFDSEQLRICSTVLACEIVIRPDKREECRVTIPVFTAGDFVNFMHKRGIDFLFVSGGKDSPRLNATVEVSSERMRDLLRESDASFEFVTEFVSEFGAKEVSK